MRRTYAKTLQNLFWATGYNIVAMPLAAGALAPRGIAPAGGRRAFHVAFDSDRGGERRTLAPVKIRQIGFGGRRFARIMSINVLRQPLRGYLTGAVVTATLAFSFFRGDMRALLFVVALLGSIPVAIGAVRSLSKFRINIDVFNSFALAMSLAVGEISSAAFIVLMLTFADILDWYTESKARRAIEELMKLKPTKALRERAGTVEDVKLDEIEVGDILVVENGSRIPVDGTIIFGTALINESSVTGESLPVEKAVGDAVLGSTLNESGVIKVKARRVGKDSTLEQMIALMKEAAKNKSRPEKLADRFAALFLPVIAIAGFIAYFATGNFHMMIALFLVACADDMAVAIPLAMTAAIGKAAKRGVVVRGGEWLESLAKIKTLVLDKTGTLTYGNISVSEVKITSGVRTADFWRYVGIAEKFSEHPIGRALFREAAKRASNIPDPQESKIYGGSGIFARYGRKNIAVGDERIISKVGIAKTAVLKTALASARNERGAKAFVFLDGKLAGTVTLADAPRPEAAQSIAKLKEIGVSRAIMFTGDNRATAADVARTLGMSEFMAKMRPEDKLRELEIIGKNAGPVGMIGDGVNDAPVLARADVGIAMGMGGTAVAVEAADVVILTDDLSRIPEMVLLGRKTMSVIRGDIAIWLATNAVGFLLVFTGIFGPALAAFYNFITDFFPLINSSRLFRGK